jgi:hypothetical protein
VSAYHKWLEQHFTLFFAFCLLWTLGSAAVSFGRRRTAGPVHPPYSPTDVRFVERYVSGSSDKNLFTRFGGAQNALVVTVLRDGLLVEPLRFFKWLLPPNFNDLEHYVAKKDILSVEPTTSLGQSSVRIAILGKDGRSRTLQLRFRRQAEFLAAMRS